MSILSLAGSGEYTRIGKNY